MKKMLFALAILFVPTHAHAQVAATPASKLAWEEPAPDVTTVSGYTYKIYEDTATGTVSTPVTATCAMENPATPGAWTCTTPVPAFTPGAHTITLTASNAAGESPRSASFSFTMVLVPGTPINLRMAAK